MALTAINNISESMKSIQICVNSYQNKNLSGVIYHPSTPNGLQFDNLMQLLLQVEIILDAISFPKASTERRRFTKMQKTGKTHESTVSEVQTGKLATFFVRMIFRQNASWQGSVIWSEGSSEEAFRSALELIMLIDSALAAEDV